MGSASCNLRRAWSRRIEASEQSLGFVQPRHEHGVDGICGRVQCMAIGRQKSENLFGKSFLEQSRAVACAFAVSAKIVFRATLLPCPFHRVPLQQMSNI